MQRPVFPGNFLSQLGLLSVVESIGHVTGGGAGGSQAGGVRGRQEAVSASGRMIAVMSYILPLLFNPKLAQDRENKRTTAVKR